MLKSGGKTNHLIILALHKLDLHAIQLGKYGGRSSYLAATLDPEVIGLPVILPASKVAVSPSNVVSRKLKVEAEEVLPIRLEGRIKDFSRLATG